jgi:hypothetical protein
MDFVVRVARSETLKGFPDSGFTGNFCVRGVRGCFEQNNAPSQSDGRKNIDPKLQVKGDLEFQDL